MGTSEDKYELLTMPEYIKKYKTMHTSTKVLLVSVVICTLVLAASIFFVARSIMHMEGSEVERREHIVIIEVPGMPEPKDKERVLKFAKGVPLKNVTHPYVHDGKVYAHGVANDLDKNTSYVGSLFDRVFKKAHQLPIKKTLQGIADKYLADDD